MYLYIIYILIIWFKFSAILPPHTNQHRNREKSNQLQTKKKPIAILLIAYNFEPPERNSILCEIYFELKVFAQHFAQFVKFEKVF